MKGLSFTWRLILMVTAMVLISLPVNNLDFITGFRKATIREQADISRSAGR